MNISNMQFNFLRKAKNLLRSSPAGEGRSAQTQQESTLNQELHHCWNSSSYIVYILFFLYLKFLYLFFFSLIFPLTLKNLNLISFSKESEINSNYPSSCIPLPNQKTPTPISEACYRQHPFLKISVKFRCELMMPVVSCMAAGTN